MNYDLNKVFDINKKAAKLCLELICDSYDMLHDKDTSLQKKEELVEIIFQFKNLLYNSNYSSMLQGVTIYENKLKKILPKFHFVNINKI